ncbi:glycerophosphodiester phosphodiesterase [Planosporangium thailandense]|uniref:Glycerophosphodiester phosphodiesterase n=1 Tax=Planosporangium thailandense TaxID=765197 RepID=A0ABX0XUH6_9ACTN|nr:glycerophosphodiester phosphodiesterase [Planosporangium thailandense]NJC68949.1 glycerophosphodiester phosphodiesterase [Planosporangium thailandense]
MTTELPYLPAADRGPGRATSPARPLVFAHRGSSAAEPEHTLAAYLRAIEEGADGVECDVRLTRDGQLVCVHDRRLERTSNGHGVVSTHTLAELDKLDFGSWHPGPGEDDDELIYDASGEGRGRILTLDRLLGAVHDANRPMRLLIETKHPTRYGAAVEELLVESLRRHGLHEPQGGRPVEVTVMSFSALAVRRTRRLAPQLPTVMLMDLLPAGLRSGRLPFGSRIGGPGVRLLRAHPEIAHRLHARGHQVYVWTVNESADLDYLIELGVEGVITDRPGFVRRRLDELGLPRR